MDISINTIERIDYLDFEVIKKYLKNNRPLLIIEKEFVRRITLLEDSLQRKQAQGYFNTEFSSPILSYVARYVHNNAYYQEILGEYYEFISKEKKNIPYYKLTLYKNINNSTLRHYVTAITVRYFIDKKKKEDKIARQQFSIEGASKANTKENERDVIDNPWFNLLIGNAGDVHEKEMASETCKKIDFIFSKLPERDVKVIKLMVMHNVSGLDAFEELEDDLSKTAKIPTSTWTTKQKQDAMALQKARALKHFIKVMNNEKINF